MSGTLSLPRMRQLSTIWFRWSPCQPGTGIPVSLSAKVILRFFACLFLPGSHLPCWSLPCLSCRPFPWYEAKPSLSPCLLSLLSHAPWLSHIPHSPGSSVPFSPKWNSCHPLPQARLVNSCAPQGPHSKPAFYKLLLDAALGEGGCCLLPKDPSLPEDAIRFCLSSQPRAFKCQLGPSKPARGQEDLNRNTFWSLPSSILSGVSPLGKPI